MSWGTAHQIGVLMIYDRSCGKITFNVKRNINAVYKYVSEEDVIRSVRMAEWIRQQNGTEQFCRDAKAFFSGWFGFLVEIPGTDYRGGQYLIFPELFNKRCVHKDNYMTLECEQPLTRGK